MTEKELLALFHEIAEKPRVSAAQIPALNLYIDQILTLLSSGSREEKALTKSMVNNYSKEKLIRPIKGKKYSREQMLQLLLICRLKATLNMEEIKLVTTSLMAQDDGEKVLETILDYGDVRKESAENLAIAFAKGRGDQSDAALVLELCQLSELFAETAKTIAKGLKQEASIPKEL